MKQGQKFIAAVAIMALSTLFLFGEDSDEVLVPEPFHRSLRSSDQIMPQPDDIEPIEIVGSMPQPDVIESIENEPQMYSLRDLSSSPVSPRDSLSWYKDQFSDMSRCMDFKCSKDVSLCDNTLPTNYDFDSSHPPCCTHILRDMLKILDESMSNLGLQYFVGFGTLLGLTRSGRIIPWTIDNDIILDKKTLRAMTELWNSEATGLTFAYTSNGSTKRERGFPRMCATPQFAGGKLQKWQIPAPKAAFPYRGFPYMDFYFGEKMAHHTYGREYKGKGHWCRHFESDIFPIKRTLVYGGQFSLNLPAKPEQLLQRYYGLDWKVPLSGKNPHGNHHQICSVNYGLEELENPKSVKIMSDAEETALPS